MLEHDFTQQIRRLLTSHFGSISEDLFAMSELLQYLNNKTRSASRGSKARSSFGNIYAIYVLVEDYVKRGFDDTLDYSEYEGARFSDLFRRQRELPFGAKLQNHSLNHRLNQEFRRMFPQQDLMPVLRDTELSRYWFNERLLIVEYNGLQHNLGRVTLDIIEFYIETKQRAFKSFISDIENLRRIGNEDRSEAVSFIHNLLRPNVDARIFELVSYSILKTYFREQSIYWGWDMDSLRQETLTLFKTGRTNANDGGIDFVMKPLGRFFQVTETTDIGKYFLDIDKVLHYPITFVIKSHLPAGELRAAIQSQAERLYPVKSVVESYMTAIEEIISIPRLQVILDELASAGLLTPVVDELLLYSRVEFNYPGRK